MKLTEGNQNKALKPHLQTVIKGKVTLDDSEAKINIEIMTDVLERLVTAMREEDDLFNALYQRPVYTGSYYEKLRVKSANEFDLNLVLRLPFNRYDVKINWCYFDSAYVTYQLRNDPDILLSAHQKNKSPFDKMMKKGFFDSENFLQQDKVTQWIQGIISKVMLGRFKQPPDVTLMKDSKSGPAFTYYLTTKWGKTIDVDLVPVIDGCPYKTPEGMDPGVRFNNLEYQSKNTWFLVPKPFKIQTASEAAEKPIPVRYWRISFPEAEKELLKDTGCLTILIKLFKLLRDGHEYWKYPLASYFIKTFFLLEYEKDCQMWEPLNLGTLFVKMLRSFQAAIEKRHIPYYFNRRANLLSGMTRDTSDNIVGRIKHICNKILLDHNYVLELYGISLKPSVYCTGAVTSYLPQAAYAGSPQGKEVEKKSSWGWWWLVVVLALSWLVMFAVKR